MPRLFRVVVSCPRDVNPEADLVDTAAGRWNTLLRDLNYDMRVEVSRWKRDAWIGLHTTSTQAFIEEKLKIEQCDLLIGIFWRRFGENIVDGMTPTEHEIGIACDAFRENGRPQVLLYFRESGEQPNTVEESNQLLSVLQFKKPLVSGYKSNRFNWLPKSR
ncbi:MAG: hypothetical protein ABI972_28120, partial [Acidobacteriota bacterium]